VIVTIVTWPAPVVQGRRRLAAKGEHAAYELDNARIEGD
jgi:hypothetical protein